MRIRTLAIQFSFAIIYLLSGYYSFAQQYNEKYRPQFHYTAPSGWVGDPCALIRHEGTYHLFTWGHAVSKDLVHWQQLPWPMKGDDRSFDYFTGSMVVDKNNTAGFGANSMIACYTMHHKKTKGQSQGISYSNDDTTFHYYQNNPVLDIGSKEFRDPQVFWYAPQNKWVMVVALAVERKVSFYASTDLKSWKHLSDFGQIGSQDGVWECPDFIELPIDGNMNKKKWFLSIAVGPNKQQYFIGDFDGTHFRLDPKIESFLKEGEGMDGVVFEDFNAAKYGKRWMANGTAFGTGPDQKASSVHLGAGHVNTNSSTITRDRATGTLTSQRFTINKKAINFLIGGGNYATQTCINLIVNNRVVRSATGDSSGVLKWMGWNVADLVGQTGQIQIVDHHTGSMGHIKVDQIMFSEILHNENREHALWSEYGCDYYAAKSCRDFDNVNGRTTWLGWMSNWQYAGNVPTWGGGNNRGMESISRELGLKTFKEGIRLTQKPIPEMAVLRKTPVSFTNRQIACGTTNLDDFKPTKNTYEIEAIFNTNTATVFGFNVCVGEGRKLTIGYDARTSHLFVDRTNCSDYTANDNFNKTFPKILYAPVTPENGQLQLKLFVDQSSIEIFINQGKVVLTALTYPSEGQTGIQVFSENGNSKLITFNAWELQSIWGSVSPSKNQQLFSGRGNF
jgi:sucrose-6-phosphate hydrolase SacC (GH32 family)